MIFAENIAMGFQSLKSNPLRSALTLLGIAVGIAAVLYVVVLGEITRRQINARLEELGPNLLTIRPAFSHSQGVRTGSNVVNLTWADAREIESVSTAITMTVPAYSGNAMVEYKDKNYSARVTGTTPPYASVNNTFPAEGRFFTEAELDERSRVCILGATVRQQLFGDQSPLGEAVNINSKRFEVIGVFGAKGEGWGSPDEGVYIPLTTAQERLYGVDFLNTIYAQSRSAKDYDEALFDIESTLRRNHRLRPDQENDFSVRRQDLFLSTIQEANTEIANFIIIIALVWLVVGGIGIANVMLVSVTERTREIGIRRAIGANRTMILLQFLVEAMVLGIAGGALGIIGGTAFNKLIIGGVIILPWQWIVYSIVICSGIGVAAGLYPAFRAARLNVIEALRYE